MSKLEFQTPPTLGPVPQDAGATRRMPAKTIYLSATARDADAHNASHRKKNSAPERMRKGAINGEGDGSFVPLGRMLSATGVYRYSRFPRRAATITLRQILHLSG